jgi:hypothetical protein
MKAVYWKTAVLILLQALCVLPLLTGARLLVRPVLSEPLVPLGTLVSWLFLVLFPYTFLFLGTQFHPRDGRNQAVRLSVLLFQLALVMGISWGIVSWLLAGNWRFYFQDLPLRFEIWRNFTAAILLLPLTGGVILLINSFMRRSRY